MIEFLSTGDWSHSCFEAYSDIYGNCSTLQPVSAVASLCFDPTNKIIFTIHLDGGYDLLGGKLEKGETPIEALKRESMEEAGVELTKWKYFGHYKVFLKDDADEKFKNLYPKQSYILFFITHGNKVKETTGQEVLGTKSLDVKEINNLEIREHPMIKVFLKMYENKSDFPQYF